MNPKIKLHHPEAPIGPDDDLERKIAWYRRQGHEVPSRRLIKTPEQIEGIRLTQPHILREVKEITIESPCLHRLIGSDIRAAIILELIKIE